MFEKRIPNSDPTLTQQIKILEELSRKRLKELPTPMLQWPAPKRDASPPRPLHGRRRAATVDSTRLCHDRFQHSNRFITRYFENQPQFSVPVEKLIQSKRCNILNNGIFIQLPKKKLDV
ncbi:hypothetical protein RRG08_037785 [Elysia crispata]|uniref:Uncharacterized protein n=1 Tax=Elysia crispata TaxID=231223 RepID=A0AAE1BDX3_9GAST|nr:hypothetical protein RRG08_037785 [Elysia crispata]